MAARRHKLTSSASWFALFLTLVLGGCGGGRAPTAALPTANPEPAPVFAPSPSPAPAPAPASPSGPSSGSPPGPSSGPIAALHCDPCFGVGDRYVWETVPGQYATTPQLLAQAGFPSNNRLLGIWLPAGWQPAWFAGIQSDMNDGYVPVFIDYTLGDLAQYGNSAWSYVQSQQQAWLADVSRLAQALSSLQGTVLVVLQPEFNVPGVEDQPGFGALLAQAASILHAAQTPRLRILVGACPGDFGVYADTTVDTVNWDAFKPALMPAVSSLDFVAFQEMRGQVFRGQQQTPQQQGLSLLPARTLAFAQYLQATYGKPILLAYLTVATFSSPNDPLGWDALSAQATSGVLAEIPQLRAAGVFGVMAMSLFDDLSHDNDGTDAFGLASRSFGLISSNGVAGLPAIGAPPYTVKQVGQAWIRGTAAWN